MPAPAPSLDPVEPPLAGRHRARTRLVALTEPADRRTSPIDPEQADRTDPEIPEEPRSGRLVRWWVPGPLREARWDPGRPGARALSAVTAAAAVVAALGVWADRPVPEAVPSLPVLPAVEPAARAGPEAAPAGPPAELVVSVVGRVAQPGLVTVHDGARVADALAAAGGALPDTDLLGLNLARRLGDGEQLLVGVTPPPGSVPEGAAAAGAAASGAPAAPVDLNSATLAQLDTLPGVGPVTAQRILDWRAAHGRFTAVEQLREVDGIGEARFATLRDLVRV